MFNHLYLDWNCGDCTHCYNHSWSDSYYQIIPIRTNPISNLGFNTGSNIGSNIGSNNTCSNIGSNGNKCSDGNTFAKRLYDFSDSIAKCIDNLFQFHLSSKPGIGLDLVRYVFL